MTDEKLNIPQIDLKTSKILSKTYVKGIVRFDLEMKFEEVTEKEVKNFFEMYDLLKENEKTYNKGIENN